MVRMALSSISRWSTSRRVSVAITAWASAVSRAHQGGDRVDQHLLGDAAHLGDAAAQVLQLGVVGADDVFRHGTVSFVGDASVSRSGR